MDERLYVFDLLTDNAAEGVSRMGQLQKNIAVAEDYQPLSDYERQGIPCQNLSLVSQCQKINGIREHRMNHSRKS
jgi:hypothetical protein